MNETSLLHKRKISIVYVYIIIMRVDMYATIINMYTCTYIYIKDTYMHVHLQN